MPKVLDLPPHEIARAIEATVKRLGGGFSQGAVARALRCHPESVRARLAEALPLLRPETREAVERARRAPPPPQLTDEDLVAAFEAVAARGDPPTAGRVAAVLGCCELTIRRRVAWLDLPPDLAGRVEAIRQAKGFGPRPAGLRPESRRGPRRHLTDATVAEAVAALARAGGRFTVAALSRALGLRPDSARGRLGRVLGKNLLPADVLARVCPAAAPCPHPPGSAEKVAVLAARWAARLPLWHALDRLAPPEDEPSPAGPAEAEPDDDEDGCRRGPRRGLRPGLHRIDKRVYRVVQPDE